MTNKILLLSLLFWTIFVYDSFSQEDYKGVDEQALADTRITGTIDSNLPAQAVPASHDAITRFIEENPDEDFYIFPEKRESAIELYDTMPKIWTERSKLSRSELSDQVSAGEYYVFQLGVYAHQSALKNLVYKACGLPGITCFNLEGYSNKGEFFKKQINISKGCVQPLWFGIQIPDNCSKVLKGEIELYANGTQKKKIRINLSPDGKLVKNQGYNEDWRLSRLNWLNSRIEQNEEVTKDYTPVKYTDNTISILGRDIVLGKSGLPIEINSYFDSGNMKLNRYSEPILSDNIVFEIETMDRKMVNLKCGKLKITKQTPRRISWEVKHHSETISLLVSGEATCEGFLDYKITVIPDKEIQIHDIRLKIPMTTDKSHYMMGMGKEGGYRPPCWNWKWDIEKSQDMVWVGGTNGGLALKLKDEKYKKQLVNIYYPYGKLHLPSSWGNGYAGGCTIQNDSIGTLITAYSGNRILKRGETYHFDFDLMVTPFKVLKSDALFNERYYHNSNQDLADNYLNEANKVGANIINIHHKKDLNPFINYPYLTANTERLRNYIDKVHSCQKRVGLYYTTRELTVNAPEIWTFRSLGDEIIYPGPGAAVRTVINPNGPHPWLINRFKKNFIPAWRCAITQGKYAGAQDISVITTPESRLDNFYLEGLDWLCKNIQIDGIYLDGTALDRDALRRARKIMDKNRPSALIDVHIWNIFREKGSYANGINLYMDLFPFVDHLWIGEGRSYDMMPDYWLVEMSGIPFGLPSQMLNQGGNRWRGMVFGLTNRPGWYGPTPKYIWEFWDTYHISQMEMFGFWHKEVPVRTDNSNLFATVYKSEKMAIIAIANWGNESHVGRLYIDWEKLGLNPQQVKARMPFIQEFQDERNVNLTEPIRVKGKQGNLIVISY